MILIKLHSDEPILIFLFPSWQQMHVLYAYVIKHLDTMWLRSFLPIKRNFMIKHILFLITDCSYRLKAACIWITSCSMPEHTPEGPVLWVLQVKGQDDFFCMETICSDDSTTYPNLALTNIQTRKLLSKCGTDNIYVEYFYFSEILAQNLALCSLHLTNKFIVETVLGNL